MNLVTLERRYTLGVSSFLLVFAPLSAQAITVEEVPNPQQEDGSWVTDMADILNNQTEDKLNTLISQLETENGTEIAVVTVPQTSPSTTPKDFTTELFNYWGIGKADEDNGILFLVSTDDRRVEIETGYGIEPILPDAKVGNIIDTKITPQFKQGNYNDGTLAGTQALVDALQNQTSTTSSPSNQLGNFFGSLPFFGLIAVLAVVTGLLFKNRKRRPSTESKSYTSSSYYHNSNTSGDNSNSDRTAEDKSSTGKTNTSSSKSDVYDWHSRSDRSSGTGSSGSNKKPRRGSSSSRYSGSSYSGSSYSGGSSSGSSSSSGGSFGGGSSDGGGAGGDF